MTKCLGKNTAQFKKIPLSEVINGIRYCQLNALNYLKDAQMILQEKRYGHAYVSVHLAIEELGKAVLLKEHAEKAWKNGADEISINLKTKWKDHEYKTKKAWKILDPTLKMQILHKKTRLDINDTFASPSTRLKNAFADFNGKTWSLGDVIDEPKIEALINIVKKVLKSGVLLQLPF